MSSEADSLEIYHFNSELFELSISEENKLVNS